MLTSKGSAIFWLWIVLIAPVSLVAQATEVPTVFDFEAIWGLVRKEAPSLRGMRHDFEAAEIGMRRAGRHWFPKLSLSAWAFSSNDPGTNFALNLEQREITVSDFVPGSLNQPGGHFFQQARLGVDFPLYEGGFRSALANAATKMTEAKSWDVRAAERAEYGRIASRYAALLVLLEEEKHLRSLGESVEELLERYSIGSKSNLVGYSGLLGLKTLRNRIEGLRGENEAKRKANAMEVASVAKGLPPDWQPKVVRAREFLSTIYSTAGGNSTDAPSGGQPAGVLSAQASADALDFAMEGEKARFLPRVGLFAQGDLVSGSRGTGTSYATGAYLQWDLFSASNFGVIKQAEHSAFAAHARAEELQSKLETSRAGSLVGLDAVEKNLELLDESAGFLEAQGQTARNLFRNGSINALQLVEVLSRRSDLIVNRTEVELAMVHLRSQVFLSSANEEIPDENSR